MLEAAMKPQQLRPQNVQRYPGRYPWTQRLCGSASDSCLHCAPAGRPSSEGEPESIRLPPSQAENAMDVWATALAIAYLERNFADREDEWTLVCAF